MAHNKDLAREIGLRIKQARKEAGGMTQRELAEILGVTERSVAAYEQGLTVPYRFGGKLEEALGRPVAWFWYGEEAMLAKDEQFEQIIDELRMLRSDVRRLKDELARATGLAHSS